MNRLTGEAMAPDHRAVIEAIARRDQTHILICDQQGNGPGMA